MPLGLVIEDDADIARLFEVVLEEAGYTVEVLYNGRAALDRLAEIAPDVVLLDLNLPSVSGVDILERIRGDVRLVDVVVIVATANPQIADLVAARADLVLIKPISYVQLRDLLARFR